MATRKENAAQNNTEIPQEPVAKKTALIYLGPNIRGGILTAGSIYREYPKHAKELFERIPDVKEFFIEAQDVPAFKRELVKQGSEAHRLYQIVLSALAEKGGQNG